MTAVHFPRQRRVVVWAWHALVGFMSDGWAGGLYLCH